MGKSYPGRDWGNHPPFFKGREPHLLGGPDLLQPVLFTKPPWSVCLKYLHFFLTKPKFFAQSFDLGGKTD